METSSEEHYGVTCFNNLNPNEIENPNLGLFVNIDTGPIRDSDSDKELALRRSVDEELALSDDSSDDADSESNDSISAKHRSQTSQFSLDKKNPMSMRETSRTSYKSDSEESDTDLRLNKISQNTKSYKKITPIRKENQSSYSSSEYSSDDSDSESRHRSPFSCRFCQKNFRSNADLTRHVRCHTGERPFKCEQCAKSFSQSAHLQRHMLIHPNRPAAYECTTCDKSYPTKMQLVGHMAVHKKKEPVPKVKERFKCGHCSKTFAVPHKYKNHLDAHMSGDLHVCDICGRAFKMESYLVVHMRTHAQTKVYTGDRPFSCNVCGKSFLSSANLDLHSTIHKYEKTSFPCELCGKEFSRKSNFVAHSKSHYRAESANYILSVNKS